MSVRRRIRLLLLVAVCLVSGGLLVKAYRHAYSTRVVTDNISLLRAADGSYSVQLRRGERADTITRVQEVGWDGGGVLVYGRNADGQTGWVYAFDMGPVGLKSWGPYSRREFLKRGPELHLQHLRTMPPARAWQRLPAALWPFGG